MNKLKKIFNEIRALFWRNKCILKDLKRKSEKNKVNLHWWFLKGGNIGDNLSPFIVNKMLDRKEIDLDKKISKTKHLFAIGSIISFGYQDSTIWGSGLIRGKSKSWSIWKCFRKLDIRAIRGPETRNALLNLGYDCPEVYGDPAILLPFFIPASEVEKKYDYVIIKHYADKREIKIPEGKTYLELDVRTDNFAEFVKILLQGRKVVSSSLHGIILAETYGIPAIMLNCSGLDHFKFKDWYGSTNRCSFPIATSIEDALDMTAPELPNLKLMQENLINAFPYDLFE
ncbi:MAG: polysaccharide pyruvyl transferase family protein [Clostridia bacterium]|nr:polysaccharide pyruvyl transferase family protein [Clostridia bacterium]